MIHDGFFLSATKSADHSVLCGERWQEGSRTPVTSYTSIGPPRFIRLDAPIFASRLRLRITRASASPAPREFARCSEAAPG